MRFFVGYRPDPPEDYKTSGLANAADEPQYVGAVFPDGAVSVRWLTAVHSFSNFDTYEDWEKVHYHPEYGTQLMWYEATTIDELAAEQQAR